MIDSLHTGVGFMNSSMADYLKVVTPHLHPELVSPLALSNIQALSQLLPPFSLAGFECRLGTEQSRVDFQVNLPHPKPNLQDNFLSSSVWQFFQDFCREWAKPTSCLHQGVAQVHLEFDMIGQPEQLSPCIFLELNREIVKNTQTLIALALRLLNNSTSSLLESNLKRCADSLPDGANITHLGAMLSRSDQGVRVNVKGIAPEHLCDYLVQIGWAESTKTLSTLVSTLSELVDDIILTFDVGETISPRIGLECFLEKQPLNEPRWQLFLDYLVEKGLCTPAKQNALLTWSGFSQKADQKQLWPKNLTGIELFLGYKALSVFWRTISFIKIVYQPDSPLEAKGYLAFGHNWFDTTALISAKPQKTQDSKQLAWFMNKESETDVSQYTEQVRSYYDRMNPLILKYVGKTYQSGLLITNSKTNPYRETNLYCAAQAGIQPGFHILDAGCGVCGPSIDIAQNIEGVKIDAITLSPAQANTAKELVQQAGLANRIQVHIGDFHHLPFANEVFNTVFFFESTGYSYDHQRLFAEVYRVLRPGGSIYIKEPFSKELPLSDQEQQELAEMNRIYVYKIARMSEIVKAIAAVGFEKVNSRDLSSIVNTKEFDKAIVEDKHGLPFVTEFGQFHYYPYQIKPTFFGEIKAHKPS
jgi:ubiquinone/menaquinone biosynthesis C-methylase UbiE